MARTADGAGASRPRAALDGPKELGLAAVVLLASLIAILSFANPAIAFHSLTVLSLLNLAFMSFALFAVAWFANRDYLSSGLLQLLVISMSMIVLGTAALINSAATLAPHAAVTTNFLVTGHNIAMLIFASLNLLAVLLTLFLSPAVRKRRRPLRDAGVGLVASAIVSAIVVLLAASGTLPAFWSSGGSTAIRDVVLAASLTFFALATFLLVVLYRESRSAVIYWYALGMAMYGVSTYSLLSGTSFDSLQLWIGRISQYSGSVFLLLSILSSLRGEPWTSAFRRSRVHFDHLFASMNEAFAYFKVVRDADGRPADCRIIRVNDSFKRVTGVKGDIEGKRGSELGGNLPDLLAFAMEVDSGGSVGHVEVCHEASGLWFLASAFSVERDHYALVFDDITERKRAEKALRESEERFRSLIEEAPVAIAMSRDGLTAYANPRYLEMFGHLCTEELYGRPFTDQVVPEDRERALELALGFASGRSEVWDGEFTGLRRDGSRFPYRVAIARVNLSEGPAVIGFFFDITKNRMYEESLRRSNTELQQFAYIASHDLQEPLRMVTSYVGLLDKKFGSELGPQAREFMHFAVDGSMRMKELIDDLLQYSRIDSQSTALEHIDMNEKMRAVEQDLRVAIEEAGAKLVVGPLPTVYADRTQMKQLLTNLISNAIKFRSDLEPRIEVSARRQGDDFFFAVKDNGIGIDPKYSDKLFKMFSRLHTKEEYPGTGIGLAISKKIVERHGGRIWFESEAGKGTTFYFTLPAGVRTAPSL